MIDVLGFHDDTDYAAELAAVRAEIETLTRRVTADAFYSYEDRHNTWSRLDGLRHRAAELARETAMDDQRTARLATAMRTIGDPELGFIAYVVFGPAALPVEPLYEVRLVDEDGHTLFGSVRTNLPAVRAARAVGQLATVIGPRLARVRGRDIADYQLAITAF